MNVIVRTIDMGNGNKVNFTSGPRDPFWSVSFERGGMPEELKGKYTDFNYAKYAVEKYLARRPYPTTLDADTQVEKSDGKKPRDRSTKQSLEGNDHGGNGA